MAEASFRMGVEGWGGHPCGASCPAALVLGPQSDRHHAGTVAQAKRCRATFVCKDSVLFRGLLGSAKPLSS